MGVKVLLTSKNSPNGIIQKIIGDNVYENILSFDNDTVRDEFINKYYFNEGEDYKVLLDNGDDKSLKLTSDLTTTIRVNLDEYPNETRMSLLNKDTCVVLEDENYYWYALINPTSENNGSVSYDAELDIFLTHDIKDIDFQGKSNIYNAMADRYIKIEDKVEWNIKDSVYKNRELITDNFISFPKEEIIPEIDDVIFDASLSEADIIDIKKGKWTIWYYKGGNTTDHTLNDYGNRAYVNNVRVPFAPFLSVDGIGISTYTKDSSGTLHIINGANVVSQSLKESNLNENILDNTITRITPKGKFYRDASHPNTFIFEPDEDLFQVQVINDVFLLDTLIFYRYLGINNRPYKRINLLPNIAINFEPKILKDIKNELKFYTECSDITINNSLDSFSYDIGLSEGFLLITANQVVSADQEVISVFNNSGSYKNSFMVQNGFISNQDNSIPYAIEAYSEFVANNKYSKKTSLIVSGSAVGGAIALAGSQGFVNPIADLAVGVATLGFINKIAERKDLKSKPNKC